MVPNLKTDRLDDAALEPASAESLVRVSRPVYEGAIESPARRLQLELERSWATERPGDRWSARRSLFFIVLTNGLLWMALIWGVARIV